MTGSVPRQRGVRRRVAGVARSRRGPGRRGHRLGPRRIAAGFLLVVAAAGCGGGAGSPAYPRASPLVRRTVVWLGPSGIDEASALSLQRVGVDRLVVDRGQVSLAHGLPVLRLKPAPRVEGILPAGVLLRLDQVQPELDPGAADALWRTLLSELGGQTPAELVLDLPRVPTGLAPFMARLAEVATVPVVPVITVGQSARQEVAEVVAAAGRCIVLTSGNVSLMRSEARTSDLPLDEQLEPLASLGVRVRVAVVLFPHADPPLGSWGGDLNALTEGGLTEVSTTSSLDRTFVFRRDGEWSGRTWSSGASVAVRWVDAARLHRYLWQATHLLVPEVEGWDLVTLPPPAPALGISREALESYLAGSGPEPRLAVQVRRSGRSLRLQAVNTGPFSSAVSSFGNWVEVAVDSGRLVAEERGDFDRILLGTRVDGEWRTAEAGAVDAIRLAETFVGAGEEMVSGEIQLPSTRSGVQVRWHLQLTTGDSVAGVVPVAD